MNNEQPQNNTTSNTPVSAPVPAPSPATAPAPAPAPAAQPIAAMTSWPGAFGIYKASKQSVMLNVGTIIILLIGNSIIQGIGSVKYENSGVELLFSIITLVASVVYSAVLTIVWLAGIKNEKISLAESFKKSKEFLLNIFLSSLLVGLATFASILLFIIPFFFVFPRLLFTPFLVIDKKMSAVDAFSASWSMSKGHVGKIYGVIGATLAMVLLSITIIGIPFSIYFIVMYSAAFALLYVYVNNSQSQPVESAAPVAPIPNAPASPNTQQAATVPSPAQPTSTETPQTPSA